VIACCSFAIALCRYTPPSISRIVAKRLALLRDDCVRLGSELRLQVKPACLPACLRACQPASLQACVHALRSQRNSKSRRRAESPLPVARACAHQVNGIRGRLDPLRPGFAADRAARRTALVAQRKADIARDRRMARARFLEKRQGALDTYQLLDDRQAVYIASNNAAVRAAQAHAGVQRMSALLPDPQPASAVRASPAGGEAMLELARPIPQNQPVRVPLTRRTLSVWHASSLVHVVSLAGCLAGCLPVSLSARQSVCPSARLSARLHQET
jgi:hypothetical protein